MRSWRTELTSLIVDPAQKTRLRRIAHTKSHTSAVLRFCIIILSVAHSKMVIYVSRWLILDHLETFIGLFFFLWRPVYLGIRLTILLMLIWRFFDWNLFGCSSRPICSIAALRTSRGQFLDMVRRQWFVRYRVLRTPEGWERFCCQTAFCGKISWLAGDPKRLRRHIRTFGLMNGGFDNVAYTFSAD
jgi:hypothetical protein